MKWICCQFGIAFLFLGLVSCQKAIKNESWFVLAQEYAEAHETMLQNEVEKKGTALKDLAVRDNVAAKLLGVSGPSLSQLDALLKSEDPLGRKVALVNVMLREIKEDRILASITETYRFEDDTHTKFFTVQCFIPLSALQLQARENRLIEIFSSEKDENVIIAALPVLTRLGKTKTRPLFANYLRSGTAGLRALTIIVLKKDLPEVLDDIHGELKREGIDMWAGLSEWKLPERLTLPETNQGVR
jgi:hypothetical protein